MSDRRLEIENMLMQAFNYKPKTVKIKTDTETDDPKEINFPKPRSNSNPYRIVAAAIEWIEKGNPKNPLYEKFIIDSRDHWATWSYANKVFKKRWPAYEELFISHMELAFTELKKKHPLSKQTALAPQSGSNYATAYLYHLDDYINVIIKEGDVWEQYEQASNIKQVLESVKDDETIYSLYLTESSVSNALRNTIEYSNVTGRLVKELNCYFEILFNNALKPLETAADLELFNKDMSLHKNFVADYIIEAANEKIHDVKLDVLKAYVKFKHKDVNSFEDKALKALLENRLTQSDQAHRFSWSIGDASFNFLFDYFEDCKKGNWLELSNALLQNLSNTWIFINNFKNIPEYKMLWHSNFAEQAIQILVSEIQEATTITPDRGYYSSVRTAWFDNAFKLIAKSVEATGNRALSFERLMFDLNLVRACEFYADAIREAKKQGHVFND